MHKIVSSWLLMMAALAAIACGSGTQGGNRGGSAGGSGGGSPDDTTVIGSGNLTGSMIGTVSNATVTMNVSGGPDAGVGPAKIAIIAEYTAGDTSNDQIAITGPSTIGLSNINSATLTGGMTLPSLPASGSTFTQASTGICGAYTLTVAGNDGSIENYTLQAASDCIGDTQPVEGTFTLDITSAPTAAFGGTGNGLIGYYYNFTGTLTATMALTSSQNVSAANGTYGPSVMLNLSFTLMN